MVPLTTPRQYTDLEILPIFMVGKHLRPMQLTDGEKIPMLLRARSALAFLYFNNLLSRHEYDEEYDIWAPAHLSEDEREQWCEHYDKQLDNITITDPQYVGKQVLGAILIHTDRTSGWSWQSPTMLLAKAYTPVDMETSFVPGMQWLNDRPKVLATLQGLWLPRTDGEPSANGNNHPEPSGEDDDA